MFYKWEKLVFILMLWQFNSVHSSNDTEKVDSKSNNRPQVEVRAVFIRCKTEEESSVLPNSEVVRFEREELYKHNAIRDCAKKLAVTVKMTSDQENMEDEYLPIEHVFEGPVMRRVRLLDPYILRLRREPLLQAFKLRKIERVNVLLTDAEGEPYEGRNEQSNVRAQRDLETNAKSNAWSMKHGTTSEQSGTQQSQSSLLTSTDLHAPAPRNYVKRGACSDLNETHVRNKRGERNVVIGDTIENNQDKNNYLISDRQVNNNYGDLHRRPNKGIQGRLSSTGEERNLIRKQHQYTEEIRKKQTSGLRDTKGSEIKPKEDDIEEIFQPPTPSSKETITDLSSESPDNTERIEKQFTAYQIGDPELWYTVHVQLFEKLSTAEGKSVWNDLTKGEMASVGSSAPEWTGQDLNVRYRPAEWISRDEFALPASNLCLLAPIHSRDSTYSAEDFTFSDDMSDDGEYYVIPEEDIKYQKKVNTEKQDNVDDEGGNVSESRTNSSEQYTQKNRKITVRLSRALLKGGANSLRTIVQGGERYLTLPHRRAHHAQLDLEARADENDLVRVGESGRISIAVSDSSRPARTVLTLQVGNTGLAAARYRVLAQECGPELAEVLSEGDQAVPSAGPELIPPRHTRSLRLQLPFELPVEEARCTVTLKNDKNKSLAVREVTIKKGDRCFCVWHCDCVCLGVDPRLQCRSMADARQVAAGLSPSDHARHARSICYPDVVTVNVFVIVLGVLLALLFLGFLKACFGLKFRCIAIWGFEYLIQMPRHLDRYYECCLRSRSVHYDAAGWPVHPDTYLRTVYLVNPCLEFFLNFIFFIVAPIMVIYEGLKQSSRVGNCKRGEQKCKPNCNVRKCFSSQDVQGSVAPSARRRGELRPLRRWMSPAADRLSARLWHDALDLRPLIQQDHVHKGRSMEAPDSGPDSDQDDTEYVLTQMQKSRESLARNQRKISGRGASSTPSSKKH